MLYGLSREYLFRFIFLFQPFIIFLTIIGTTENYILKLITEDGGLQSLIGMFQGLLTVYVYGLGSKLKIKPSNDTVNALRHMTTLLTFFSVIISVGIFVQQAPYTLYWVMRTSLLISGSIIGVLALSMGFVYGKDKTYIVRYIGAIIIFSISTILGITVLPLTSIDGYVFPAMSAFVMNTILLVGVVGYLISDKDSFLTQALEKLRLKFLT